MLPIFRKFSLWHYNIGFFNFDEQVMSGNVAIHWMAHSYKDRFFADPFILTVSGNEIKVLVEEYLYKDRRGRITLLTIKRDTYQLIRRKVLLDLPTHLSFPFIYRTETDIYVIPENSESGKLHAYRYDATEGTLYWVSTLVEQPVIDPVIIRNNSKYLLFGSLPGIKEHSDLFVWQSDRLLEGYKSVSSHPVINSRPDCARRGGDFFTVDGTVYSAVQSCVHSYGEALRLCRVNKLSSSSIEEKAITVLEPDKQYPDGLHTFNRYKDVCVVDGLTFLFRPDLKLLDILKRF
jgi:hypothetical protein